MNNKIIAFSLLIVVFFVSCETVPDKKENRVEQTQEEDKLIDEMMGIKAHEDEAIKIPTH